MTSFNPRANVFLLVNLGCEMLYVVDQRLKAQQIAEDKSIQVIHDITAVLLEPKFIDSIIVGSTHSNAQLLTADHCKFMLKDIATCSLMRLDDASMDKLWNLMTMIYKWQLFVSKHQHHLLDITFRHLNEISKMHPESKREMLIDFTKNTLLDFWNSTSDEEQHQIYRTNIAWLQCFNTKISVLIRLGFQTLDGEFVADVPEASYYQEFVSTIGDNIYVKSVEIVAKHRTDLVGANNDWNNAKHSVNQLAELLNFNINDGEDLKPIDATQFQQQFEKNLQQCNILFEDLDVNSSSGSGSGSGNACKNPPESTSNGSVFNLQLFPDSTTQKDVGEFVQMKTVYNRNLEFGNSTRESDGINATGTSSTSGLKKDLLDFYSKLK